MNTSNLHAANATSVVGNAMSIPPRTNPPATAAAAAPGNMANMAGAMSAAAAAQLQLNQMRAAFKPAVPVAAAPAPPLVAPAAPVVAMPVPVAAAASVTAANPAVPNTAGAGAINFSGRWYLDREDSDSTNDYLEAMVSITALSLWVETISLWYSGSLLGPPTDRAPGRRQARPHGGH
jgi:hypothetical protein